MGAVDLVIQVESPPSVASGLQRTGRAGHHVGDVSRGVFFPKYQGDLVQATVVTQRMRGGQIEQLRMPRNPLDVLAQQIVAMTAMDDWEVGELEQAVRRAAPFSGLTRPILETVLDMLAGRYPSEDFGGLRPRLVWDRTTGMLHGRPGGQRLAVSNAGTIPDRGLFGVFLAGGQRDRSGRHSRRVGELDEEMVYESRVGDIFVLGASSWRIEDITADQVLVSPGARPARQASVLARGLTGPPGRARCGDRCLLPGARRRFRAGCDGPAARRRTGRAGRSRTWCPTWPASGRRPATCPMTARWCWSGSGTSWATGGWCCTARTARRCTRPGRWPSRPGCGSATPAWTCRPCTPTTAS